MRHRKSGYTLSRKTNERKALFLSLIRTFFEHGHLTSTVTKIKAIHSQLEKLSVLGVRGDLAAKRELFRYLQSQSWVNNVCEVLGREFPGKTDNFTITKNIKFRQGDDSLMVLVSYPKEVVFSKVKAKTVSAQEVKIAPAKVVKGKTTLKVTTRTKSK